MVPWSDRDTLLVPAVLPGHQNRFQGHFRSTNGTSENESTITHPLQQSDSLHNSFSEQRQQQQQHPALWINELLTHSSHQLFWVHFLVVALYRAKKSHWRVDFLCQPSSLLLSHRPSLLPPWVLLYLSMGRYQWQVRFNGHQQQHPS